MEEPIYLTQDIGNDSLLGGNGFIDNIESKVKAVFKGDPLNMVVSNGGGDVYDGNRLSRMILEHNGHTEAFVTGLAASMSGVLLADFDYVRADSGAKIMLHKGHIDSENLTPEDEAEIRDFNQRAHDKIKAKILSKKLPDEKESLELLRSIFLVDSINKDFWFTASEAKRFGLVDEVTEVTRENGSPTVTRIAASLNEVVTNYSKLIYENYKQMGIFKKDPVVARIAKMKTGESIVFNSAKDELQKGDSVTMVDSVDPVNGTVLLSGDMQATIVDSQVENIEEATVENQTPEEMSEMLAQVIETMGDLVSRVEALEGGGESAATEDSVESLTNEVKELKAKLGEGALKSSYKLPKVENKSEKINSKGRALTPDEQHAVDLRAAINHKVTK